MAATALCALCCALARPLPPLRPAALAARPRLPPPAAAADPELPRRDLPPPSEDGGPLSWMLPASLLYQSQVADRAAAGDPMVGEDAATFDWNDEKMGELLGRDWLQFFAAVGAILSALAVLWIYPATGYGDDFVAWLEELAGGNSHLVTLAFGLIFPLVHSGLASLRPYAEQIVGARTCRRAASNPRPRRRASPRRPPRARLGAPTRGPPTPRAAAAGASSSRGPRSASRTLGSSTSSATATTASCCGTASRARSRTAWRGP